MKNATLLGITAATTTLFTACLFSGESSAPGRASVNLEIKASASTSALAKSAGLILGDTSGVHVDLSDAKLVISRIKLESESGEDECGAAGALKKGGEGDDTSRVDTTHETGDDNDKERECEEKHDLALKGPFVIDLLTGASTPDLGTLSVPAGAYDKIKIEMHRGQNDSTLGGRTLVAHGTLTLADGSSKPFSLSLTLNENLRIKADSGLSLHAGALNTVTVKLIAADWLKGLDLAPCLATLDSAAASVDITEDSPIGKCLDAEHVIKANFRDSFHAREKGEHEAENGKDDADTTGHSGKGK